MGWLGAESDDEPEGGKGPEEVATSEDEELVALREKLNALQTPELRAELERAGAVRRLLEGR